MCYLVALLLICTSKQHLERLDILKNFHYNVEQLYPVLSDYITRCLPISVLV